MLFCDGIKRLVAQLFDTHHLQQLVPVLRIAHHVRTDEVKEFAQLLLPFKNHGRSYPAALW
jgi:hypothetical protein